MEINRKKQNSVAKMEVFSIFVKSVLKVPDLECENE